MRKVEERGVQWVEWREREVEEGGWSGVRGKGVEWGEEGKRIELLILCITYRYRLRTNAHVS